MRLRRILFIVLFGAFVVASAWTVLHQHRRSARPVPMLMHMTPAPGGSLREASRPDALSEETASVAIPPTAESAQAQPRLTSASAAAVPPENLHYEPSPILPRPMGDRPVIAAVTPAAQRRIRSEREGSYSLRALVTAYCPCSRCCGKFANGRTSTRSSAWRPGVAVDPKVIPYGSRLFIPGYGEAKADDTGVAMRRSWRRDGVVHLDVRFNYHYRARKWGTQRLTITVTPPH